ncbi:hypothetical protein L798_12007 [Zootermopsis nevadensis]|uniref:Uncharacterized protein n=1 Tax=Zootermopsis nevadensis TaxID=136037 RepID=A0A067QVK4_ZOONE|nr:hypothetical protein L798_12007 [Zootermopsis nevadensis]
MRVVASRVGISYGCPATFLERQHPTRKIIPFRDNKPRTTGSLLRVKSPGKTWTSEENVDRIREAFQRSPRESIRAASLQLQLPRSTVRDVLHKRLRLRAYKIQMIHAVKPTDQVARTNFAVDMLERIRINDLQHLKARTRDAVATVTPNMLQATWNEVDYRLDICRATRGAHIEIY